MCRKIVFYNILVLVLSGVVLVGCGKSPEEELKASAKVAQRNCPQVIDETTSMISAEYVPPRTLKYTYLVNREFTVHEKNLLDTQLKEVSINIVKNQPEFPFYLENDVSFEYVYLNREKEVVVQVDVVPSDYK